MHDTGPDDLFLLAFREGVSLGEKDGLATVLSRSAAHPLKRSSPGLVRALSALSTGGASEKDMVALATAEEGSAALPVLFYYLERFKDLGFLTFAAHRQKTRLAVLERTASAPVRSAGVTLAVPGPEERVVLSRLACIRSHAGRLVVESPLAHLRVAALHPDVLTLCHALAEPRKVADLTAMCPEAPALLALLMACRAVEIEGKGEDSALAMWGFHEALFHTRSRLGRNVEPVGATYRFHGKVEPHPAAKVPPNGPKIELHRPDIEALKLSDISLSRALEERRSRSTYGEQPITAKQVGELLFRSARVRELKASSGHVRYPASSRPYPGAGGCYELEFYLVVNACEGLGQGLHHYEPVEHALTQIEGASPAVQALLAGAGSSMGVKAPPQVMLVLSARFARSMWKYESNAYALILKDVGVVFQTVALVACSMGLACCPLGNGDSDLFAGAAGLDYFSETSVGEMALGSAPS